MLNLNLDWLEMHLENLLAAANVRLVNGNLGHKAHSGGANDRLDYTSPDICLIIT